MRRSRTRKFGRVRNQRKALYKALATALVEHGKIKTTVAKAKSLSKFMDKLISKSKKSSLVSRKIIGQYLGEKAAKKMFVDIGPRFKDKSGGYTTISKLGRRKSDGAETAIVEFTL